MISPSSSNLDRFPSGVGTTINTGDAHSKKPFSPSQFDARLASPGTLKANCKPGLRRTKSYSEKASRSEPFSQSQLRRVPSERTIASLDTHHNDVVFIEEPWEDEGADKIYRQLQDFHKNLLNVSFSYKSSLASSKENARLMFANLSAESEMPGAGWALVVEKGYEHKIYIDPYQNKDGEKKLRSLDDMKAGLVFEVHNISTNLVFEVIDKAAESGAFKDVTREKILSTIYKITGNEKFADILTEALIQNPKNQSELGRAYYALLKEVAEFRSLGKLRSSFEEASLSQGLWPINFYQKTCENTPSRHFGMQVLKGHTHFYKNEYDKLINKSGRYDDNTRMTTSVPAQTREHLEQVVNKNRSFLKTIR